jgi:hypothetical protein
MLSYITKGEAILELLFFKIKYPINYIYQNTKQMIWLFLKKEI